VTWKAFNHYCYSLSLSSSLLLLLLLFVLLLIILLLLLSLLVLSLLLLCPQELAQWSSLEAVAGERLPFPVGSLAVRQARQATLRAHQAEQHLAAAVAERDSLARQVEELKPPEMQAAESPSGQDLYLL